MSKPEATPATVDERGLNNDRLSSSGSDSLYEGSGPKRNDAPKETDALLGSNDDSKPSRACQMDMGALGFLRKLRAAFGVKLLVMLFSVQHMLKGFVDSLVGMSQPYIYRHYKVPAPQMQVYQGVTRIPWAMKPILGLTSDVLPIFGYNKGPYMVMVSVLGCVALLCIGVIAPNALGSTGLVVCLFLSAMQQSMCDLLSEAKYAEKIREHPSEGPSILTYVWFGLQFAGLIATLISGPMIHYWGPRVVMIIVAVPAALVIVPIMMGYMEERKATAEEVAEIRKRYAQQKEACVLCFVIFTATIALTITGLVSTDPVVHAGAAIIVGFVVLGSFSLVLSPVIAKFNAFSLIQTSIALSTGGASFYFYTDTPEQYPEGPHFSEFFYNSVMGTMGSIFSLLGIFLYHRYFSSWKYRNLMIMTNVIYSCLAALDILMFARINVKLGIPDHVLVMGLSVFESIILQWQWMPQVVILSYLCPKGMEATMYALLAGCANLGQVISANCGALLLDRLGVKPSGEVGESEQFKNLWICSTVATVLPLVAILVLFHLIPDARQNERLITDTQDDATTGSLWRRWTKND